MLKKSLIFFCLSLSILCIAFYIRSPHECFTDYRRVNKVAESEERKLKGRIILAIGDSNGNLNDGWPSALQNKLKEDLVLNNSEGGRTIGFDNCGKPEWNALRNIDSYLSRALKNSNQKSIDEVIILLGTNDSKACFDDRKDEVTPNLIRLITKIRDFDNAGNISPHITIVTPPPYGPDSEVPTKALGGDERVRLLIPQFRNVALKYGCGYVNIYDLIKSVFHTVAYDHVHLTRKGHMMVAEAIAEVLNDHNPPKPPLDLVCRNDSLFWKPSPSRDVIGYEVFSGDRFIDGIVSTEYNIPPGITDIMVHACDRYGNVSISVRP